MIQATASLAISAPLAVSVLIVQNARLPEVMIGAYTTLVYVGALFGTLLTPVLLTRLSVRTIQIAGLGMVAVGMLLFGLLSPSALAITAAAIGVLMMGLTYGALVPASAQILSDRFSDRLQPLVVSIKQTGVPVGTAVGALVAPMLVTYADWSMLPISLAIACIVIMVATAPQLSDFADVDRGAGGASISLLSMLNGFQYPALRRLMIVALVYGINQSAMTTFLVPGLVWVHGLSVGQAAGYLALATGAGAAARIFCGITASRFGRVYGHLGVMGILSGVAWLLLLLPQPDTLRLICGALLIGATAMGWNGLLLAQLATDAPPGQGVTAVAAGVSLAYFGVVIGPMLFSAVLLLTGNKAAAIFALGAAAVVVGFWLLLGGFQKTRVQFKGPDKYD